MRIQILALLYAPLFGLCCISWGHAEEELKLLSDLKSQEQFLKRHFPDFTHPEVKEHILRMTRWHHNKNRQHLAKKSLEIYEHTHISRQLEENTNFAVSRQCLSQIAKIAIDADANEAYARFVEDSTGRQASGLLRGDYLWLGKYYECKGQTDETGNIVTRMCLAVIGETRNTTDGLYLGTCFPEICDENDVASYLESVFNDGSYVTPFCAGDRPYSKADIAAICVFSILACFVLVGTICETIFICLDLYYEGANPTHEKRKNSVPAYLLLCFSLIKNTKTLFNTDRKESTIEVLDGIRFLSMAWVILGHAVYFSLTTLDNALDVMNFYITHFGAMVIVNGTFSVDSFFFLSGLLITYLTMREMRRSGSLNIPIMYLHRYLRLTPTLVVVMLFSSTLYMRIAEEPIYEVRLGVLPKLCEQYWWSNLLYINNLYPANFGDGCISWVWYLANDWQFFVISPVFVYLLYKHRFAGFVALASVLSGNIIITGSLASYYDLYPDVMSYGVLARALLYIYKPKPVVSAQSEGLPAATYEEMAGSTTTPASEDEGGTDYFADIYVRPWCRIGAYVIGMMAGYILYATNKKFRIKLFYVMELWIAAFALGLTLIYGWWGDVKAVDLNDFPSVELAAFYEALKRPLWAVCLMWLTIGCSFGYGGPINAILSWKVFIPLSRLTFCAYLVHPLVLFYMYRAVETEPHFRVNVYIYYYIAGLVLSYAAAYVLSMLVEAPMAGLQKIIFYTPKGKKPWYSIFNINVETNSKPTTSSRSKLRADLPSAGTAAEISTPVIKDIEVSSTAYAKAEEAAMSYDNHAATSDDKEIKHSAGSKSTTAF